MVESLSYLTPPPILESELALQLALINKSMPQVTLCNLRWGLVKRPHIFCFILSELWEHHALQKCGRGTRWKESPLSHSSHLSRGFRAKAMLGIPSPVNLWWLQSCEECQTIQLKTAHVSWAQIEELWANKWFFL